MDSDEMQIALDAIDMHHDNMRLDQSDDIATRVWHLMVSLARLEESGAAFSLPLIAKEAQLFVKENPAQKGGERD